MSGVRGQRLNIRTIIAPSALIAQEITRILTDLCQELMTGIDTYIFYYLTDGLSIIIIRKKKRQLFSCIISEATQHVKVLQKYLFF